MPPRTKIGAQQTLTRPTRRSARQRETRDNGVTSIYSDMLAEAAAEEQAQIESPRPSKRRKISEEPFVDIQLDIDLFGSSQIEPLIDGASSTAAPKPRQVVFDDFEASDESDVEFEDVDLEASRDQENDSEPEEKEPLQLDLSRADPDKPRHGARRRKPVGHAERKLRLDVHKAHLVCLLAHLSSRNSWCESDSVHKILKPLIPRRLISLLHVEESKPQFQRSHAFNKAIEEICLLWRTSWTISARGMRRAHWKDDVDALQESEDAEDLIDLEEFLSSAHSKSGSRDLGAQLFCALLRAVAVDTRLVCSLQVLPFSGVAKGQTPEKPKPLYQEAPPQNYNSAFARPNRPPPSKKRIIESPYPIFWVEVFSPSTSTWIPLDPLVRNTINKPKTGFEPPLSDNLNLMTYVIAFEDDGSAKDVTKRYTQWFNAKTRKQRVETTKGGEIWWKRTMGVFHKTFNEDRDEVEDAELIRRAESEAMPRSVQDFKGHPVYVLERHLRMNEVIHPRHEVGKVSAGPSKSARLESVFRRRDVHLCRTADAWYRRGKDVNEGEQPLKRVLSKRRRDTTAQQQDNFTENDDDPESEGAALYAEYQTSLYIPPPVVGGQIPRNAYGNLDVYVPSMIPGGAVHIRHPLAMQAAKVLGIDFAEAVTGFEFKGRQGTAVIDGVVVSMDQSNVMVEVIQGLESQATEEVDEARSRVLLGTWKRWLTALRVREKVHREYGSREEEADSKQDMDHDDDDVTHEEESDEKESDDQDYDDAGGGFMPEAPDETESATIQTPRVPIPSLKAPDAILPPEVVHREIIIVKSPHKGPNRRSLTIAGTQQEEESRGGFLIEDAAGSPSSVKAGGKLGNDRLEPSSARTVKHLRVDIDKEMDVDEQGGGFIPEDETAPQGTSGLAVHDNNDSAVLGGGFMPDSELVDADDDQGGGFIVDQEEPTHTTTSKLAIPHKQATSSQQLVTSHDASHSHPAIGVTKSTTHSAHPTIAEAPHRDSVPPQTDIDREVQAEVGADSQPRLDAVTQSPDGKTQSQISTPPSPQSATSLLSHDPEEDDAEPEWLLNSLG